LFASTWVGLIAGLAIGAVISWWIYNRQIVIRHIKCFFSTRWDKFRHASPKPKNHFNQHSSILLTPKVKNLSLKGNLMVSADCHLLFDTKSLIASAKNDFITIIIFPLSQVSKLMRLQTLAGK